MFNPTDKNSSFDEEGARLLSERSSRIMEDPTHAAEALFDLGEISYKKGHTLEALQYYFQAGKMGCEKALFRAGGVYAVQYTKHGDDLFFDLAADFLGLAPQEASYYPKALYALGVIHFLKAQRMTPAGEDCGTDESVRQSLFRASADYYAKASSLTDLENDGTPVRARYALACMYYEGVGREKDIRASFHLYKSVADSQFVRGHTQDAENTNNYIVRSMITVAGMTLDGNGQDVTLEEAEKYNASALRYLRDVGVQKLQREGASSRLNPLIENITASIMLAKMFKTRNSSPKPIVLGLS